MTEIMKPNEDVDVSGCRHLSKEKKCNGGSRPGKFDCSKIRYCYYKQYKREAAEKRKYKSAVEEIEQLLNKLCKINGLITINFHWIKNRIAEIIFKTKG